MLDVTANVPHSIWSGKKQDDKNRQGTEKQPDNERRLEELSTYKYLGEVINLSDNYLTSP